VKPRNKLLAAGARSITASILPKGLLEHGNLHCVFSPTGNTLEHAMPYLFWAVLPFALMDTWWGLCEQHRDTSE
jgi:hypothetical protein